MSSDDTTDTTPTTDTTEQTGQTRRYYEEEPRISDDVEVNSALARVVETCACGSKYQMAIPSEFRNDLQRGVNTWRKYHACSARFAQGSND